MDGFLRGLGVRVCDLYDYDIILLASRLTLWEQGCGFSSHHIMHGGRVGNSLEIFWGVLHA